MAKTTAQTASVAQPMTVEQVMEMLRKPAAKSNVDLVGIISDRVADSGQAFARIGAGISAATDNMADAYKMEQERQLRRRAERIVALATA